MMDVFDVLMMVFRPRASASRRWRMFDIFFFDSLLKGKNLLILAAAGFFSLDATSGLLATASASAPAMFLALRPALLCVCCMT